MSGQDQRCGTCKWWERTGLLGRCSAPLTLPDAIDPVDVFIDTTREHDGTRCPCWAPIENGETQA